MSEPTYIAPAGGLAYERILPAVRCSVGRVRRELDLTLRRADAPDDLRDDAALVASEAVTNVVMHAYVDMPRGPVYAGAKVTRDGLVLAVADAGRGMVPRSESPGLGYGLPLIGRLCDDLVVGQPHQGTGTIVTATFRRPLSPPPSGFDRVRHDSLKEYVRALLDSSAEAIFDARALVAEADQALRRGEQIRRVFLRAG